MNEIAISVKDVGRCYRVFDDNRSRLLHHFLPDYIRGMHEVWVPRDESFAINRGKAVAIIGRNRAATLHEICAERLSLINRLSDELWSRQSSTPSILQRMVSRLRWGYLRPVPTHRRGDVDQPTGTNTLPAAFNGSRFTDRGNK